MTTRLAGCVFLDAHGSILLMHRKTESYDHWEIPGGKIEANETVRAAAIRESQEELGVRVTLERRLGQATFSDKGRLFNYIWWLAHTEDVPQVTEPHLFTGWQYFGLDTLLAGKISLSEGAKTFIELSKSGEITL